ncbi:MAG TPA: hypothetical protein VH308_02490 [Terracidiphilus sp.]|jgi:methyl-accepting chemotaxis protein|nr:hypothetical protein [Terracidiphilus sp.]
MQSPDSQTTQLVIVAAVAITMLLQTIALFAILIVVRKSVRSMRDEVEQLRTSILGFIERAAPVFDGVRQILTRTGPKIESTVADLAAMSANLRRQTNDVQTAATEIVERFRRQSARADAKLTNIFDVLERATNVMTEVVSKPMRQFAGILASAKAVMETLRNGTSESHVHADQPEAEKEHYL